MQLKTKLFIGICIIIALFALGKNFKNREGVKKLPEISPEVTTIQTPETKATQKPSKPTPQQTPQTTEGEKITLSTNPHFKELNGHKVLFVQGVPFITLSVEDPKGFSRNTWDDNPPKEYERYYAEAKKLAFNTVAITFPWYNLEKGDGVFSYDELSWHKAMAEKYGQKLIIVWIGTVIAGESNGAPQYLKNNPSYPKVLKKDGALASDIFSLCNDNILAKEQRALNKAFEWIKTNDKNSTFIMLQLESEFYIRNTDRPYDETCNKLYNEDSYKSGEEFYQKIERKYIQKLAKSIHEIMPDFPITMNLWPGNASPDNDPEGWIRDVPDVSLLGPDIYGWPTDKVPPYYDKYSVSRNISMVTEIGADQTPYLTIFPLLGEAKYNGIGMNLYQLVGNKDNLFKALLSHGGFGCDGNKFTIFDKCPSAFTWFDWAYYTRNSFSGIKAAAPKIAQTQNTSRLIWFLRQGGDFNLAGTKVKIKVKNSSKSIARGFVIKNGENDFTLVGVNYEAEISASAKRIERGYWRGDEWIKTAEALPNSLTQEGNIIKVIMSPDDLENQDSSNLQYIVRVY